jgi:hypothetical protein
VAGKIRNQEPPSRQERRDLRPVPGGTAKAVQEQKRRPLAALEDPEACSANLVEALREAQ